MAASSSAAARAAGSAVPPGKGTGKNIQNLSATSQAATTGAEQSLATAIGQLVLARMTNHLGLSSLQSTVHDDAWVLDSGGAEHMTHLQDSLYASPSTYTVTTANGVVTVDTRPEVFVEELGSVLDTLYLKDSPNILAM